MDKQQLTAPVGATVVIATNGIEGRIKGHYVGERECFYDVEYADRNGAIFTKYFRPDEVS